MGKLIQLANGQWIDLTTVTGVMIHPAAERYDLMIGPCDRLKILMGAEPAWIEYDTRAEAIVERDRIAALVNKVVQPDQPSPAADELARLRAENERIEAEIERLHKQNDLLRTELQHYRTFG